MRRALSRHVFGRRLPHGLISWRYLWVGRDARIKVHRRLWWESGGNWPRSVWGLVQLWLWLRWDLWFGWRASWRTVKRLGPEVRAREGISLACQAQRTLALSLGWCIPPRDVYRFRLYRRPEAALDYVFDQEMGAFQSWRGTSPDLHPASLGLLQDKAAFAAELGRRGVPVVPTGTCVPRYAAGRSLAVEMRPFERVFCKTRSGGRGEGAFSAWRVPGGMEGWLFGGAELHGTEAVEGAWRALLALDDALVQPCLVDHPALAALASAGAGDVVTVRFISQRQGASLSCLSATLEIPTGRHEMSDRTGYTILPIEAKSGRLQPFPGDALRTREALERAERTWARAQTIASLPHWGELVAGSYRAHAMFPDVWAIAWDWVITADGPLLLEGNSGWGPATPQVLYGGLLREGGGEPAT